MTVPVETRTPDTLPTVKDPRWKSVVARDAAADGKPDQRDSKRQWVPDEIRFGIDSFSLGLMLVAQSSRGVCAVLLGDDGDELRQDLANRFPGAALIDDGVGLETLTAKVIQFVESPARGLDVALDMRGSEFQRRVWHALQQIPAGTTASYSDVAHQMGMPRSARAVARACAMNPLAVVVPCHRVVTSDGKLSGYRWGVQRKRGLLEREAQP